MQQIFHLAIIIMILMGSAHGTPVQAEKKTLNIGFSERAAPWKMMSAGKESGAEAEMLKAISQRLKLQPVFEARPFKRNLNLMKTGQIDILTGILKRPEREQYIHFINPPYKTKSNKAFYVPKGNRNLIKTYQDLYGLTLGANLGSKYFKQFDEDPDLNVEYVATVEQNIQKLLVGRIDAFIVTDSFGDYHIRRLGVIDQIEKTVFIHSQPTPVYIGISKKSPLMDRISEIEGSVQQMITSGQIDAIFKRFFKEHDLPLPDYH